MSSEFHIFASDGDRVFTVKQAGLYGSRVFPSLAEATRHLREYTKGTRGMVVIHDDEGSAVNRIPLHLAAEQPG